MQYLFLNILLLAGMTTFAQSPAYLDEISDLLKSAKDGKIVALKGEIVAKEDGESYFLRDRSGEISLDLSAIKSEEIKSGDMVTLNGKLSIASVSSPEVNVTSLRKNSYVENPSRCCMPEI